MQLYAVYASFMHRICDYNWPTINMISGIMSSHMRIVMEIYTAPSDPRVINIIMLFKYKNYQFHTSSGNHLSPTLCSICKFYYQFHTLYANCQYDPPVIAVGYAYDLRRICEIAKEYAIHYLYQCPIPVISMRNIDSVRLIWAVSAQVSNYHLRVMQFIYRVCNFYASDMQIYGGIWEL